MEVGGMLPSHSQEEISPIKEGDYVGEDGLIRCGVCGKRKQFKIEISGFKKIVPCICKCRSDEIEKEKQKDGSVVIKIIKQYNTSPIGDYLNEDKSHSSLRF